MNPPTVQELRNQGYTVRFNHLRRYIAATPVMLLTIGEAKWAAKHVAEFHEQRPETGYVLSPNGGKTICTIRRDDGEIVAVGETTVNDIDIYDKRLGRVKSFGRAAGEFQRLKADEAARVANA